MQVATYPSVMIAEAAADTRELLRYWLETKRCRVIEVVNGQEAVAMTHADRPDLILMGINMQVLDGLDAARRIRADAVLCGVPIVCMSTYPTKEAQATALAAGCNWFMAQPIDFDQLNKVLETLRPAPTIH
jgi:CheY-like chemotaxis protein